MSVKRNLQLEKLILAKRNLRYAYQYSANIINRRWPEAEPYIMKDPKWAYYYAYNLIIGKWIEAEPYIMKSPEYAYYYAFNVSKRRWPEAEPYMKKNNFMWTTYKNKFNLHET